MDIVQVLRDLTFDKGLPIDAIRAADADRDVAIPAFIAEVERYVAGNAEAEAEPSLLFFIFHMLGSWREKSAYRPLAKLLRLGPEELDDVLGDAVTVTSHRVMAGVFDGDPTPLYKIILDSDADEFIRSRMLEALAMVTLRGDLAREQAARFLQACWNDLKPEQDCYVWNGWQSAIAMLGLSDLKSLVKAAFERGSIDSSWLGFRDFEQDLEDAIARGDSIPAMKDGEYTLFGDTIEEMSKWHAFRPEYEEEKRRDRAAAERNSVQRAVVPLYPKVGRNDLCPCSSGKKFKKCCLNLSVGE
jgi:hypothetical protein